MLVGFGTAGTAFGSMVTASHGVAEGGPGLRVARRPCGLLPARRAARMPPTEARWTL